MSGDSEPHAAVDPDSILEGVVAIDSAFALESIQNEDGGFIPLSSTGGLNSTESGVSSDGSNGSIASSDLISGSEVVDCLPDPTTKAVEAGPETGEAAQVEQSTSATGNESQGDRAAANPANLGDETTSSTDEFKFGENVITLKCKSTAPGAECSVYVVGTAHVSQVSTVVIYLSKSLITIEEMSACRA
jgi:hypothetical protein